MEEVPTLNNGRKGTFVDLQPGVFSVSALDPISGLKGAAGGELLAGKTADVRISLESTATLAGVVMRAGGELARGISAELTVQAGTAPGRR